MCLRLLVRCMVSATLCWPLSVAAQDDTAPKLDSVYSDLSFDMPCVPLSTDELGGTFHCAGYAGYGVLVAESDLRTSVFFGHVGEWYAEGAWESFQSFNSIGNKVEWRLRDGIPIATIVRWSIYYDSTGELNADDESNGNVLVVSKVGQPAVGDGCVIGYVDARANEDANTLARDIADGLAAGFQCRVETAQFHGEEGILTPVPVRSFGP